MSVTKGLNNLHDITVKAKVAILTTEGPAPPADGVTLGGAHVSVGGNSRAQTLAVSSQVTATRVVDTPVRCWKEVQANG